MKIRIIHQNSDKQTTKKILKYYLIYITTIAILIIINRLELIIATQYLLIAIQTHIIIIVAAVIR